MSNSSSGKGRLQDHTVLITGGSSGIGRETAIAAAAHGARVVNADIQQTPRSGSVPTSDVITDAGGDAEFMKTDVTDFKQVQDTINRASKRYGGIDAMVNNAARGDTYAITDTNPQNWAETLELNLTGVYHGSFAAIESMIDDGGAIVNIASVAGVTGFPNSASYSASKGGVIALTRQMARDYANSDIRVNSISPGFIDTPMFQEDTYDGTHDYAIDNTPMSRIGEPREIADTVVFLISTESSFITGQNIIVDGGYSMS